MRDFWRGEDSTLGEFASRLTGSSDLYQHNGRRPTASINFITAHDGFTLNDLVSYNDKHNEANGEDNRDGESHNRSWNCGAEGETDDPEVLDLRARQRRNFLTTLLLSQGTPMLAHGDEIARTQGGNNNVYCQDNEIAWMDWSRLEEASDLHDFTRRLIELRRDHPVFRRRRFLAGGALGDEEHGREIAWLTPECTLMTQDDWNTPFGRALMVFLDGEAIAEPDARGQRVVDDSFLLMFNAHYEDIDFTVPGAEFGDEWEVVVDTTEPLGVREDAEPVQPGAAVTVGQRSTVVLRRTQPPAGEGNSEANQ